MREMKDSGNMWIGATPETWKMIPLKYLASYNDEVLSENTDDKFEFDYIEIGSVQYGRGIIYTEHMKFKNAPSRARRIVRKDDIIVSTVRTYLKAVATIPACNNSLIASTGFIVIRPHKVLPRFMNYALLSESFISLVESHSTGISYPAINSVDVVKFKIPVPCRSEQERIAAFLDAECAEIDAVLEKTRASIEEYKKLKQAVITQAVTKGIRGDRPMKDSGIEWIGEIPEEWDVVRQKYFWNTVESGVSVNAADKPVDNSEQYGVLKTSAVSKFVFIPTEHKQVNLEEYGRVSCPVRADSIIASRMNTPELVGACGYVQNNYPNLFLPDRLWQITFKDGLSPKYAWYYLSGIRVRQYISSLSTGTSSSMQNSSQSQYGNIFITIPSIGEQSEITKYLDEKCRSVDALIAKKQQYLTEIENYKKSLIYEYVTGKKEVV